MNVSQAPKWLPEVLIPFFTLSYPTARPTNPDSYPTSNYYGTGRLDGCFVLMWILVLGILRECLRLVFLEPFARQYLYRKDMLESKTVNGTANGVADTRKLAANGNPAHPPVPPQSSLVSNQDVVKQRPRGMSKTTWIRERRAVRFAEQGWQFTYYIVYWPLGLVGHAELDCDN
jgi:very-long-chain ceramide synthase